MQDNLTTLLALAGAVIVVLLTTLVIVCYKWFEFGQLQPAKPQEAVVRQISTNPPPHEDPPSQVPSTRPKKYFPVEFHELVQDIITTFEAQRKEDNYQFAALLLSEYRNFKDIGRSTELPEDFEATDCESRTFPPDDALVNYVTAGPRGADHAETILLGKLDALMDKFGEEKCKTILLYTWLLQCDGRQNGNDCNAEMLEKLGAWAAKKQVILVYTTAGDESVEDSAKMEDEIVRGFREKGIHVLKEKYYDTLLPLKAKSKDRH